MGDHADDAINESLDFMAFCEDHRFDPIQDQYDMGLCDEFGFFLHRDALRFLPREKISGPGKCPKCGADTVLKTGKFGEFYGCVSFPKCHGSRYF